ncbi:MAG: response regulator [Terriglobales bacterium]
MGSVDIHPILLVEDDADIANLVKFNLEREGFPVTINATGAGFLDQAHALQPALVILDLMLPAANGLDLLRLLRREPSFSQLPAIILTARGDENDRVRGLDSGADDYISKPFSARELVARVRARLRQSSTERPEMLEGGPVRRDLRARTAQLQDAPLELSDTEFRMLAFLMKHAGRALTRRAIVDAVWSPQHFITERTVDVYMLRLRNKLEENPEAPRYLVSVRRVGYRFDGATVGSVPA